MNIKTILFPGLTVCLIIGLMSSCSNYYPRTYLFMDWSNPDSLFSSYDTIQHSSPGNHNYIFRLWIDPSSTVKQCISIYDTNGGFNISMKTFGYVYNKKEKARWIERTNNIATPKDVNEIVASIDSLDLMSYKSRYYNWQTDAAPMHTPMIWYRVEYYRNGQSNDFVFWNFLNYDFNADMLKYKRIVDVIDQEVFNNEKQVRYD